jgi:16S rRNA (cytosine1402-N4)-methyltransferase
MLEECLRGLNISPGGVYVDLTFGGGGHSRAILSELDQGRLIAFDQDEESRKNRLDDKRFLLLQQNFRFLKYNLKYLGIREVDGILADLGVSSHHLDAEGRGFTYRSDAVLDMRMNREQKMTAADVLNDYPPGELERLFREYAEIKHPGRLVTFVVRAREERPFRTVSDLLEALRPMTGRGTSSRFLSRIFQALRIEVNEEMEALKEMLLQVPEVLRPGGRLVVISYHSLEDRLVKQFIRQGSFGTEEEPDLMGRRTPPLKAVNRKVITPAPEEIRKNPRARSAKLRIAEKI